MLELVIYAVIFLALIGHILMAFRMYMAVHTNKTMPMREKNAWKVKALVFPAYYWPQYKKAI
ncbi:MAG TPA: hypothetical protein VK014_01945 [Cyclobacteriaceae bacterium]|nr:hypothetical protein [Cyclobacteriaceae bacterium]